MVTDLSALKLGLFGNERGADALIRRASGRPLFAFQFVPGVSKGSARRMAAGGIGAPILGSFVKRMGTQGLRRWKNLL
jgi:hypothetical protein